MRYLLSILKLAVITITFLDISGLKDVQKGVLFCRKYTILHCEEPKNSDLCNGKETVRSHLRTSVCNFIIKFKQNNCWRVFSEMTALAMWQVALCLGYAKWQNFCKCLIYTVFPNCRFEIFLFISGNLLHI